MRWAGLSRLANEAPPSQWAMRDRLLKVIGPRGADRRRALGRREKGCVLGRRLTWERVDQIRALRRHGWTYSRLAAKFGVSNQTIFGVCTGKTWKVNAKVRAMLARLSRTFTTTSGLEAVA